MQAHENKKYVVAHTAYEHWTNEQQLQRTSICNGAQ